MGGDIGEGFGKVVPTGYDAPTAHNHRADRHLIGLHGGFSLTKRHSHIFLVVGCNHKRTLVG